jgi:hypothetical protein
VVLGILAGIVVFGVGTFRADATQAACKADLKTANVAADAYNARNAVYPPDMAALSPGLPATGGAFLKTPPTEAFVFDVAGQAITFVC